MATAIEHQVSDRVEQSFVIFGIRALWRSALSVRVHGCQNPVWHWMPYSCTNMATVGVKWLTAHQHNSYRHFYNAIHITTTVNQRHVMNMLIANCQMSIKWMKCIKNTYDDDISIARFWRHDRTQRKLTEVGWLKTSKAIVQG